MITYTNRKDVTYTLCKGETKTGKPRYFFAREPQGELVEAIPEGYEIRESVNGVVSLAKVRPGHILAEDVAVVTAAIQRHPRGRNYRVDVKPDRIDIYELVGGGMDEVLAIFDDGVFGDAQWSNKDRLPDPLLKDLIEHFSSLPLGNLRVTSDIIGDAYEYLIKQFADATNRKAGEFYTPRSVVRLMVDILNPQEGETVYDPACGTGGMLLAAVEHVRAHGGDPRTFFGKLYGQERNLTTASVARMNLFLHGIEDFTIARGDTLERPAFTERDRLRTFDVVLANPPYSIKQWNRDAWQSDPWGRNLLGTPPQGRADYAFFQHILASMDTRTGRCAILFPHGVLFRKEEAEMRAKLVQADLVECVLGLGPNLFYNSPMEACVVVCRTQKPPERRGRILFIDAVSEVARERAQSFLKPEHQVRVLEAYRNFGAEPDFAVAAATGEIAAQGYSLSIPLYMKRVTVSEAANGETRSLPELWAEWEQKGRIFWQEMDALVEMLDELMAGAVIPSGAIGTK